MSTKYLKTKAALLTNKENAKTVVTPPLIEDELTATENKEYTADVGKGYTKVTVNVANSYTASDEGKVVDNGALIEQSSMPNDITENGTYNTTLYNEVDVAVPPYGTVTQYTGTLDAPFGNENIATLIEEVYKGNMSIVLFVDGTELRFPTAKLTSDIEVDANVLLFNGCNFDGNLLSVAITYDSNGLVFASVFINAVQNNVLSYASQILTTCSIIRHPLSQN